MTAPSDLDSAVGLLTSAGGDSNDLPKHSTVGMKVRGAGSAARWRNSPNRKASEPDCCRPGSATPEIIGEAPAMPGSLRCLGRSLALQPPRIDQTVNRTAELHRSTAPCHRHSLARAQSPLLH